MDTASRIPTRFLTVLAAWVIVILCGVSSSNGQTYTPIPYNFSTVPMSNTTGKIDNTLNTQNLAYSWMCANGYGQWATGNGKWYLLGNGFADADKSNSHRPVPSGVVDWGSLDTGLTLSHEYEVKVACNLIGCVRFVAIKGVRGYGPGSAKEFVIQGFNDYQFSTSQPKQIDHRIIGMNVVPNSLKVVRQSIATFKPSVTASLGVNHNLMTPSDVQVTDWRDVYDIACDQKFLYIVWVTYETVYQVYGMAIKLSDNTIAMPPTNLMDGYRPTVSCDIRNNPSSPVFDVACIQDDENQSPANVAVRGQVKIRAVRGSFIHPQVVLPKIVTSPCLPPTGGTCGSSCPPVSPGDDYMYTVANHARILTSSAKGMTSPIWGVYVFNHVMIDGAPVSTNGPDRADLIFYPVIWGLDANNQPNFSPLTAKYVDGKRLSNHAQPVGNAQVEVSGEPMIAFTNPYDGEANSNFNEFHCVYRLRPIPVGGESQDVLMIVRGYENGCWRNPSNNQQIDTRTILNVNRTNSSWVAGRDVYNYVAAVNQMGIHVRWWTGVSSNINYYTRDMRTFNEDIDENTLVTYECQVNSTSCTLKPGRAMTLWTDPFFGDLTLNEDLGIFVRDTNQPDGWNNAQLKFLPANATLNIGNLCYTEDPSPTPAQLFTSANFLISFTNPNQTLAVNCGSEFHFYGVPSKPLSQVPTPAPSISSIPVMFQFANSALTGDATISLKGKDRQLPDGVVGAVISLTDPAKLYIHGGSQFRLPRNVSLLTSDAEIEFPNERAVQDRNSYNGMQDKTGELVSYGAPVTLTTSKVNCNVPSGKTYNIMTATRCENSCTLPQYQFDISRTRFTNRGLGEAVVRGIGTKQDLSTSPIYSFGTFNCWANRFAATKLLLDNPINDILIWSNDFDSIRTSGIHFTNHTIGGWNYDRSYAGLFEIRANHFFTFGPSAKGILFEDFEDADNIDKILVWQNKFIDSTKQTDPNENTAIHFNNSSGIIMSNEVDAVGYGIGILNNGASASASHSLLCNNTISKVKTGSTPRGIETSDWNGYGKINVLDSCIKGHVSNAGDRGHILFSTYKNSWFEGLDCTSPSSVIDLRGIHNSNEDYAAYNYIGYNDVASNYTNGGQIGINESPILLGTSSTTNYATYGQNTFIMRDGCYMIRNYGTSTVNFDLNQNYWADIVIGNLVPVNPNSGTSTISLFGTNITHNSNSIYANTQPSLPFGISCGKYLSNTPDSLAVPHSNDGDFHASKVAGNITPQECDDWYLRVRALVDDENYSAANDTARLYIESCPGTNMVWHAFNELGIAVGGMSKDNNRWLEYREWLKSVLYNDPRDYYYCEDALQILKSFNYLESNSRPDLNGQVAIIDYLLEHGRCDYDTTRLFRYRKDIRRQQYLEWATGDTTTTKIDTSKKTIDDIGLSILRGLDGVKTTLPYSGSLVLGEVYPSSNPFTSETTLNIDIKESAIIRFELLDLMGRAVQEETPQLMERGTHTLRIDGANLANGTYYARFTTGWGEVKTIKLKHLK